MQDKTPNIDKALIDRGWSEMRKMLDLEMPVEKSRRRPVIIWWTAAAAGLAAALLAFWLIHAGPGQQSEVSEPGIAVVEQATSSDASAGNQQDATTLNQDASTSEEPTSVNQSLAAKNNGTPTQNNPIAETPTYEKTTTLNRIQISPDAASEEGLTLNAETAPGVSENISDDIQHTVDSEMAEATAAGTAEASEANADLIAAIEELALVSITPVGTSPVPFDAAPFSRRFSFSAYSQYMADPQRPGGGVGAGVIAGMQLGRSSFSLESGAGYQYLQQPLAIAIAYSNEDATPGQAGPSVTNADVTYSFDKNDRVIEDYSGAANNAVLERSLDLHYARIPVELVYRKGRLRAMAGANVDMLVYATPGYTSGGLITNGSSSLDSFSLEETETSNGFQIPLANFDFGATAGLGYDISPKFGIDLKYRAGLTDVIENNSAKEYNRFFQLSLRYSFTGK